MWLVFSPSVSAVLSPLAASDLQLEAAEQEEERDRFLFNVLILLHGFDLPLMFCVAATEMNM